MQKGLIGLALALAATGLYLAWSEAPQHVDADVAVEAETASPAAQRSKALTLPEPAAARPEAEPVAETREAVVAPEPAQPAGVWTGRIVLATESGELGGELDGMIELWAWTGNRASTFQAPVVRGTFTVEPGEVDSLSVHTLTLDGWHPRLDTPDERYDSNGEEIVIRAHEAEPLILNVLDLRTGAHLDHVTIRSGAASGGFFGDNLTAYPTGRLDVDVLLREASSPVRCFPPSELANSTATPLHVYSPGHAWTPISVDFSTGGEREIRLPLGGDLEVHISGPRPRGSTALRIRRRGSEDKKPYLERPSPRGGRKEATLELTGVAVGDYVVTYELGKWYDESLVLGKAEVTVTPGGHHRVQLEIEAAPEVQRARLAGELHASREWELEEASLLAVLQGPTESGIEERIHLPPSKLHKTEGTDSTWTFDFGDVPVGDYRLEAEARSLGLRVQCTSEMVVPTEGLLDASITFPPAGRVHVELIDPATGAPCSIRSMSWRNRPDGGPATGGSARLKKDSTGFDFLATVGKIRLRAFGNDYVNLDEDITVVEGANDFTVELELACKLRIRFVDGETTVPLTTNWYPSPKHLDGTGKLLYVSTSLEGWSTALSEPGDYVFEMPRMPGFAPIPDQTITVRRSETTKFVVQLTRGD
jgi:hypothetical protein